MVVEDPPGGDEEFGDRDVPERITHGQSLFLRRDEALIAQHRQLLRHRWLIQAEGLLEFLHGAVAANEVLEN